MRLIDADALKIPYEDGNSLFAIACAPTIDAVPVEHAKWINPTRVPDSMMSECSACGFDTGSCTFNYCPNCGAKMTIEGGQCREEDDA